jgi:protein-S-isoprenylcysteine O-methyltransferase Ste14
MIAFSLKIRREETALGGRFGDAYLDYAQSVPAILPHLF